MFLALAFALMTTAGPGGPGPALPGVVRGQVRSESTGAPLALAIVELVDESAAVGEPRIVRAVTDSLGEYVLRRVPAGRHLVRATHFDHAPFEVEVLVPPGGDMVVDLSLALRPLKLAPVTARAHDRDVADMPATAPELSAASMRLLEASPGMAELGLAQAARGVPGGSQPSDPSEVLYVRGGAADLKLVLLDGAPVYAPYHVGGLLTPFETDALRSAKLYLGGAPARYDGGLSYVLDLHTRSGRSDGPHAAGAVDLLSARTVVDGPFTRFVTYMVAVRGVHDLGVEPLVSSGAFPYSYGDGLGRLDIDLGGGRSLRATGFFNREGVRLDAGAPDATSAYWGNSAGSVRFHGKLAGADAEITGSTGEYDAMLPVGGDRPMLADGTSRRMRVAADFGESFGAAQLHWGASYDRLSIYYLGWSLLHQDSLVMHAQAGGNSLGGYIDAGWQPLRRLQLRGGVRADLFGRDPQPRLGPRLSATWVVGDRSTITLAAGQYHQYVRATEAAVVSTGADPKERAVPPLSVAQASHLLLSLDQEVAEGLRLGLEGYYKSFQGVPSYGDGSAPARASGVDLWVRRNAGEITGWLGYSLSWVWSANGAQEATDLFAGRQLLSAGVGAPVIGRAHLEVRLSYGSGMPFTAVPQPDRPAPVEPVSVGSPKATMAPVLPTPGESTGDAASVAPGPDDPYLRVDAQLARNFDGRYRGIAFHLTPYVRVLNALDRRDALFYQYDRTRDRQPQAVGALPVLPIVGFAWRF